MLNEYVFSVLPWAREIAVVSDNEKTARRIAWDSLPDMAKDNTEGLECVDEYTALPEQVEGVAYTQFRAH